MTASSSTFPRSTDSSPAPCGTGADMTLRPDLPIIADAVPAGPPVLDIGRGDGALIAALRAKGVDARRLEPAPANATAATASGPSGVQGNSHRALAAPPSQSEERGVDKVS